ncbi:MAG TPA: cell division protein FtsK [Opitutae bacterium]|nr:cell division protein FtsK [Opitutaceae bacterium]HCR31602.1 cell division protein FtsK [Opitutae bacterium]
MARKRSSNNKKPSSDIKSPRLRSRWLWAGGFALLAALFAISLLDFHPRQIPDNFTDPSLGFEPNAFGLLGVKIGQFSLYLLGGSAWLIPAFLGWRAWLYVRKVRQGGWAITIGMLLNIAAASGLLAVQNILFLDKTIYAKDPGGLLGQILYSASVRAYIGDIGTTLILGALFIGTFVLVLTPGVTSETNDEESLLQGWLDRWRSNREEKREARRLAKLARNEEKATLKQQRLEAKRLANEEKAAAKEMVAAGKAAAKGKSAKFQPEVDPEPAIPARKEQQPPPPQEPEEEEPAKKPALKDVLKIVAAEETKKARVKLPQSVGDYIFPPLDLLAPQAKPHHSNSPTEHTSNADRLQRTLKEFGVDVTMGEIHIGPVITRYEVYPAPGVRVEKISNLDKNIALGMRAQSVRILAPVPGKGCVGIEVPNMNPTPVGIREILESEDWAKSKAEIPIALGKDVSGKPIISDLTKMPHLLIAGATGAGKTVCINSIITSLLFHSSPDTLRFIMVDPKIVEMKVFNSLPHMLIPVVTDPKKVPGALKWLINEMEHRYETFAKAGVRNIAGFNGRSKPETEKTEAEKQEEEQMEISVPRDEGVLDEIPEKFPYIVCIIDELADLMMVAPADVETGIARLAQLARAAGIHLVIATQRPSVNVITGVIKANLPCRISFQVSSKIDSRTILDGPGAEQLIGRGDMLFSPPGSSKLIRSQGAFVSDEEIASIVDNLKSNGPPKFAEEVQKQIEDPEEVSFGGGEEEGDDLLPQAIEVLRSTKRASTSMLQRRLRIGYNRAARLMEELEERGVVGPENGSSPREILVDLDTM